MARISDHAVLRYLERVKGVDVASARTELEAMEGTIDIAAAFGAETIIMGNGGRLRLQGDVAATCLEKRGRRR